MNLSSNSPRYFVPANTDPRSRLYITCLLKKSGQSLPTISNARPSAQAVLPTPASPTKTGLFLRRRANTLIKALISLSRPITGSKRLSSASCVKFSL